MISRGVNPEIFNQLPHFFAVFYARKAFDLHAQGMPREAAADKVRAEILASGEIPENTIFPPIPWDKYADFVKPKETEVLAQ